MPRRISEAEKLACVRREIAMRARVYPVLVDRLKMTHDEAEYELRVMRAIAADYEERADAEVGQGRLV